MILLATTTDIIRVITSAAGQIDCLAPWIDAVTSTAVPSGGGTGAVRITTATTTTLVAAPAASTLRNVKKINLRNSSATTANTITVEWYNGTITVELYKVALAIGEMITYVEGMGWSIINADGSYKASSSRMLMRALDADASGQLVATVQPWFPSGGAVTLAANTSYAFEGLLQLTTGTTTHTTAVSFTGTAGGIANMMYEVTSSQAAANTMVAPTHLAPNINTSFVTNATSGSVNQRISVADGIIRNTTAGTMIPNFTFSANPTTVVTVQKNTHFKLWPVGADSVTTIGTWA